MFDPMSPLQLWLFDEPPVSRAEIEHWVLSNADIAPDSWRFSHYVRQWDVAGKIARIKQERRAANDSGKPSPRRRKADTKEPHFRSIPTLTAPTLRAAQNREGHGPSHSRL
jgi:hypothetical protein